MNDIKRILVTLDLSYIDNTILNHIKKIVTYLDVESIYFLHVVKDMEKPEGKEVIGKASMPVDERIALQMKTEIGNYLTDFPRINTHILVKEGDPSKEILHTAKLKDIDLIILGNKEARARNSHLTQHVVNYAKSSVLLIPDFMPDTPDKIIIPIDFSKHSKLAFQLAHTFTKYLSIEGQAKIEAIHVFEIPSGYHYSGKSEEEFGEILKQRYEEQYDTFLKENGINGGGTQFKAILKSSSSTAKSILKYTQENDGSCILMGSKGRTELASMLLGGNARRLVEYNDQFPLVIVKDKHESEDLISSFWSDF